VFADSKRRITYRALEDEILRCAELYRHIGIRRGDVVTVQLPNRIEFPVAFFALELIGAIANKVNPDFRARELDYILKFSGSSAYGFRGNLAGSIICRWRKASVNRYPV
jgi:acyl-coenzyme A synthetase/AMP-(fatty) acid ligase